MIFDATANRGAYRERAREGIARFAEVYVSTPVKVCAARDTKGLYRAGAARTLPGVQVPYEAPLSPELVISGIAARPQTGQRRSSQCWSSAAGSSGLRHDAPQALGGEH